MERYKRNTFIGLPPHWKWKRKTKSPERGLNRTNYTMKNFQVTMKLTCGPVTSHTDGVLKDHSGKEYINKNIVLHAQYSNNPEDNNFASATPFAKLEFALGNPAADIFAPGRKYKITLEEWPGE